MDKGLIPRIADDGTPAGPHQVPSKNEGQRQTGLKEIFHNNRFYR